MSKRTHAALLALLIAPVAWGQSDPMTLEDVASLKSVSAVRMSPNGDRIAYLQTVQREVYVDDCCHYTEEGYHRVFAAIAQALDGGKLSTAAE